jgi:hypothetical protein
MRHVLKGLARNSAIFENDEEGHSKFSDLILVSPQEAAHDLLMDFLAHGELKRSVSWVPHPNFRVVVKSFSLRGLEQLISIVSEKIQGLLEPSSSGWDRDDAKRALEDTIVEFVKTYKSIVDKTLNEGRKFPPLEKAVGASDPAVVKCPILMKGFAEWGIKDFKRSGISEGFKAKFEGLVKEKLISLFNQGVFMNVFLKKRSEAQKANLDEIRDRFTKFVDYIASELYNQVKSTLITPSLTERILLPSATWVTYQDRSGAISIASLHEIKWLTGKKDGSLDDEIKRLIDVWLERLKKSRELNLGENDRNKLANIIERIRENDEFYNEIVGFLVGYVNNAYEDLSFWLDRFLIEIIKLMSNKKNADELLNLFFGGKPVKIEKVEAGKGRNKYFFYL